MPDPSTAAAAVSAQDLRRAVRDLSLDLDRAEARIADLQGRIRTERALAKRQGANLRVRIERLTAQLEAATAARPTLRAMLARWIGRRSVS